jgi:iron complex transport system substrate-binding protein
MTKEIRLDHVNRKVEVPVSPRRILSLCPSITHTLFALDLADQIVGRTQFCIHPADQVQSVPKVGGTKQIDYDMVDKLNPDLIIVEKEENPKEMVEKLAESYPVYVTDVEDYTDALQMIHDLGVLTNREQQARSMVETIEEKFRGLQTIQDCKVAYVIWRKPYMGAGSHTYIDSLLKACGFTNVFQGYPGRYPEVREEDFCKTKPDFIFLSSEPFPFKEPHREEFRKLFPDSETVLVDGEMFSWYGAQMTEAAGYFNQLLTRLRRCP